MRALTLVALTASLAATAVATQTFAGGTELTSTRLITGLARPVYVCHAPGDEDRIFVVEQRSGSTGRIRVFDLTTNSLLSTPFLSVSVNTSSEQGLLGMAFHPDYQNNGYFFINYTQGSSTYVKRYEVSSNPNVADAGSATTIRQITQPASNHNGGCIQFGPDGYLYIGMGDGGSAGDPWNNAQNTNDELGKMLRVDVDSSGFPAAPGNPFLSGGGHDDVWSYGWRNPWRFSFDRETGDMYAGDVGQNAYEEISFEAAGAAGGQNYGWRCYEGDHSYNTSGCPSSSTMTFPIYEQAQGGSPYRCSITGGYVYRGPIQDLQGTYFWGDYCAGQIWSFRYDPITDTVSEFQNRSSELQPNAGSIGSISSFGEDAVGNLYVCDLNSEVFKIHAAVASGACCFNQQCIFSTEASCSAVGGEYQGDNIPCDDVDCVIPNEHDDCDSASVASDGSNSFDTEYTTDGAATSCDIGNDMWMSYTAPCSGTMFANISGTFPFSPTVGLYTACPSGSDEASDCSSESFVVPCTAGQEFLLQIGSTDGTDGQGSITFGCIPGKVPCDGDCNGDDVVNVDDILEMLSAFGAESDCDTDGNGIIDVVDILALLSNWGDC